MGTKYVRLVVTDAAGRKATVEHNVVVGVAESPPPSPPENMSLPSVSGSTVEGQMLSASTGSWTGAPTSYAYQWEDCAASGGSCSKVAGATGSSYRLAAGDVGHALRVLVTASNSAGSTAASSAATAPVTAHSSEEPNLAAVKCFEDPEEGTATIESCGYPGLHNTGPEPGKCCNGTIGGSVLDGSNTPITIEGKRVEGEILIKPGAKDVHLINDEIINTGTEGGRASVKIERGADKTGANQPTGTIVSHDRLGGVNKTSGALYECLISYSAGELHAEYDSFTFCGGIKPTAGGVIKHDFCDMSIELKGEHSECISDDGDEPESALVLEDNTFFNPKEQTASIFLQAHFYPMGQVVIKENFLAGGGYTIYLPGNAEFGTAGNPEIVKNNRFARACPEVAKEEKEYSLYMCSASQKEIPGSLGRYELCTTATVCSPTKGTGYYARGGQYGQYAYTSTTRPLTWEGNFYDDNHEECSLTTTRGKTCY